MEVEIEGPIWCKNFMGNEFVKYGIKVPELANEFKNSRNENIFLYKEFSKYKLFSFKGPDRIFYKNFQILLGMDPRYDLTLCLLKEYNPEFEKFDPQEFFENLDKIIIPIRGHSIWVKWHMENSEFSDLFYLHRRIGSGIHKLIVKRKNKEKILDLIHNSPRDLELKTSPLTCCIEDMRVCGLFKLNFKRTEDTACVMAYSLYGDLIYKNFWKIYKDQSIIEKLLSASIRSVAPGFEFNPPIDFCISLEGKLEEGFHELFYKSEEFSLESLQKDKFAYRSFLQRILLAWSLFEQVLHYLARIGRERRPPLNISNYGIDLEKSKKEFGVILKIPNSDKLLWEEV